MSVLDESKIKFDDDHTLILATCIIHGRIDSWLWGDFEVYGLDGFAVTQDLWLRL